MWKEVKANSGEKQHSNLEKGNLEIKSDPNDADIYEACQVKAQ